MCLLHLLELTDCSVKWLFQEQAPQETHCPARQTTCIQYSNLVWFVRSAGLAWCLGAVAGLDSQAGSILTNEQRPTAAAHDTC